MKRMIVVQGGTVGENRHNRTQDPNVCSICGGSIDQHVLDIQAGRDVESVSR